MADPSRVTPQPILDGPLPLCKGYQRLDNTALSTSAALTVPNGTTLIIVQAEGAPVRWRPDTDPTASVGMLIADGGEMLFSSSQSAIAALRFIRTTASSLLNVLYF